MTDTSNRDAEIAVITEKVDQRWSWRRTEDIRRNATMAALATLIFAGGVAWTTAIVTVNQKVDKTAFADHVTQSERRFLTDSITRLGEKETLARIEAKQDSTNRRLTALICENKPAYCQ